MNANTALHPAKTHAARIARHLRPAAALISAWVSTEAGVRTTDGVLRPAVMVATGEPPYDGVVTGGIVLIVELQPHLVGRWAGADVPEVWAPWGRGAVAITGANARIVPAADVLVADRYPSLTLPVSVLRALEGDTPGPA